MRNSFMPGLMLTTVISLAACQASVTDPAPIDEAIIWPASGFTQTATTAVDHYTHRMTLIDSAGPQLQSVLMLNPDAKTIAAQLDASERKGLLHGVPVLLKDNIETLDPMPTTAGALALKDNFARRDAPLAANLRAQGAVILGKTNLSQWANFRSTNSISGWSAIGGQTRNPHILDRSPCGSSSGSGAAIAAGLAAAAVGTETNGSVICPSAMNGIVGFKPTVGLISQTGIVPISSTQDTAGAMTLTVSDAALMTQIMADSHPDLTSGLGTASLKGVRIGVLRFAQGERPGVSNLFANALATLEAQGAILVDIEEWDRPEGFWNAAFNVLKYEFKATLNEYLSQTPDSVKTRTLAQLIAFNEQHADTELALFDQDILQMSEALGGLDSPEYIKALNLVRKATQDEGLDAFLTDHNVSLVVAPSTAPSFLVDPVHGDQYPGGVGAGYLAAIAGYPHLTVPMGAVRDLPVGLSFMSTAGGDKTVLEAGYVYEQASQMRITPKFLATARDNPEAHKAMMPLREP